MRTSGGNSEVWMIVIPVAIVLWLLVYTSGGVGPFLATINDMLASALDSVYRWISG